MSVVLALDNVKPERIRNRRPKSDGSNSGGTTTSFFSPSVDSPDHPSAFLVQFAPGGSLKTHYHNVDQFQVLVKGEGTFGRHHVRPCVVHFARGHTPYGPLLSEGGWGFLTLRIREDPGTQRDFERLKQMPGRQPWQGSGKAVFPPAGANAVMLPMPEISDDRGLFASAVTVPSNGQWLAPDPSGGNGQYIVATKGSLLHDGREHHALALVFVKPDEQAFRIPAGATGFEGLVLNFPLAAARQVQAQAQTPRADTGHRKWQCVLCAFAYDEALGMPDEGIAPGTRWEDVPENWSCPDCAAAKSEFQMVQVQ